jgi:hypothetical protein
MTSDLIQRLADLCPTLAEVRDPTRINPLECDVYPVASAHLARETPDIEMLGGNSLSELVYEVRITARNSDELELARREAKAALIDWRPPYSAKPMRFGGGEVIAISGPLIQWRDVYTVSVCEAR